MGSIASLIGNRIRMYRTKKGLSQAKLAEKSGCHHTYIGSIERGEKVPTIDTIYNICEALELPMEVLTGNIITGDDPSKIAKQFYELTNPLPQKEQEELYELLKAIIHYKENNK